MFKFLFLRIDMGMQYIKQVLTALIFFRSQVKLELLGDLETLHYVPTSTLSRVTVVLRSPWAKVLTLLVKAVNYL